MVSDGFDVNSRTVEPRVGGTCSRTHQRVFIDANNRAHRASDVSLLRRTSERGTFSSASKVPFVSCDTEFLLRSEKKLPPIRLPSFSVREKSSKKKERSGEDDGVEDGEREMDVDGTSGV